MCLWSNPKGYVLNCRCQTIPKHNEAYLWMLSVINVLIEFVHVAFKFLLYQTPQYPAKKGPAWLDLENFMFPCLLASLLWRHNGRDGFPNHQPHDCLRNRFVQTQIKESIKALRHCPLCVGNSPGPVNPPHKWPVTWKMFPFHNVIMCKGCEVIMMML